MDNSREKLDIYSQKFDPLLALTSEFPLESHISFPIYDNIAQWQKAVLHSQKRSKVTEKPSYHDMRAKRMRMADERAKRAAITHDERQYYALFYQRLYDIGKQGPLSFLYDIWKSNAWVKVSIVEHMHKSNNEPRIYLNDMSVQKSQKLLLQDYLKDISIPFNPYSSTYSRGFLIGKLECFDKHMNLVLSNVLEGITNKQTLKNLGIVIRRSRRKPPKTKIQRVKLVYYRVWPLLFLQGNQIIHVQRL